MNNSLEMTNLAEVLAAMIADNGDLAWDDLPVFSDCDEPNTTLMVWSWDEKNAIVGAGKDDLVIIPKTEIDW